jgi:hypothetical protein
VLRNISDLGRYIAWAAAGVLLTHHFLALTLLLTLALAILSDIAIFATILAFIRSAQTLEHVRSGRC